MPFLITAAHAEEFPSLYKSIPKAFCRKSAASFNHSIHQDHTLLWSETPSKRIPICSTRKYSESLSLYYNFTYHETHTSPIPIAFYS